MPSYYASELLDDRTCDLCEAIDGTEYFSLADAEVDYPGGGFVDCAGGGRCRGTLVAVYTETGQHPGQVAPTPTQTMPPPAPMSQHAPFGEGPFVLPPIEPPPLPKKEG